MHQDVLGVSYFGPVKGSSLFPQNFLLYYFLVSIILAFFFLALSLPNGLLFSRSKKAHIRSIFLSILTSQVFLTIVLGILIFSYLLPTPKVTHTSFSTKAVEIDFDHPVARSQLQKEINPNVPGVWIFDNPVYATHLYRKVIFYPTINPLIDGTKYTIRLKNIENVLRIGKSQDYSFTISTPQIKQPETASAKQEPKVQTAVEQTVLLPVPAYLQQHTLSCEVSALRMALDFFKFNVSEEELLAKVGVDSTPHYGNIWGNPNNAFVGNVNGSQMRDGYGVYWGPIARAASGYTKATAFTNWTTDQLIAALLRNHPSVIWVYSSGGWPTSWKTTDGQEIYAVRDEHTVVAVGFIGNSNNPTYIIVNDPLVGQVYWQKSFFDSKWGIFHNSGVVLGE